MERVLSKEVEQQLDKEVTLFGWVSARRDHGKIIFIDLRDRWGITQIVFDDKTYETASKLSAEDVIKVFGTVKKRPEGLVNPKILSGKVEIQAKNLEILAESITPPFEINDTSKISEDLRMKYRYLDLRSDRMKNNLKIRSDIIKFIRDRLISEDFLEIETPLLTKSTPEGARDYLVPSRLHAGKFYALPQSPQQFKQLLMVSGVEKYFQIARCLRDEDPRGDRQPEHTQLDMELSFVSQKDVMEISEVLVKEIIKEFCPKKNIQTGSFPVLTYKDAISKYQTDRPDLRKNKNNPDELAFCWIIDFPFFEKDKEEKWTFTHNPFSDPMPEDKEKILNGEIEGIRTTQYDLVLNGEEIGGGSIRSHKTEVLSKVFEILGYEKETINDRFGHMLEAFKYGVPPHGGIAWGLDRLIMIIQNEPSIREVIAFPKTGDGRDLLMNAPSNVDESQLKELNIKISK
ncbi:MAG: Aspartyl-tRNA synthetase [Berkelbacteria bacterium GW2011_GWB1_38_5]|uniref:Aspartate--tRNA(Asp/Asn) ligase n=2 Tax=Candidatus Berkelbacteria TaxID=1618330 RepID=A0A0G0NYJ1_9BACT|nr:MAG: Aspartyl-tRNA synthetase [Berkelbacteria bacterium GW2011_GWB1_38_5]KKQ90939.1 MAG: Aspartyl-tRNA synthetase [Berkelbacteria bacterium GW2011_GWA1_39_10]